MIGLDSGYIELHPETNKICGGGIYKSNWPSNETKWKMFLCMKFSKSPDRYGVWQNTNITPNCFVSKQSVPVSIKYKETFCKFNL